MAVTVFIILKHLTELNVLKSLNLKQRFEVLILLKYHQT